MNEKTRLLELFKKAADSADMFKDDKQEVMNSPMLSKKGKDHEIAENRQLFVEAMTDYRERMLAIVNEREEDYTAYHVRVAQQKMSTSNYQTALTSNLDMLKRGYMGKIEIMALLKLYNDDDLACSRIEEVMKEIRSPYIDMLADRITVKKQLNAFESIRRIIRTNVTGYLAEKLVYMPPVTSQAGLKQETFSREACYFGSGYTAIIEELDEDLTINSPDATLAMKINSDTNMTIHHESNVDVMKAEHNVQSNPGMEKQEGQQPEASGAGQK